MDVYKGKKVAVLIAANNEEYKINRVIDRIHQASNGIDAIIVVDDGSTDATSEVAKDHGAIVLSQSPRQGVGAAFRRAMEYAKDEGFDLAILMAGNNKDDPREIPRLLDPICDQDYDIVMGSRFIEGGGYGGDMPLYRKWATRLHPKIMSLFVGKKVTESTNGFRAFKLSILDDKRINLHQRWLDRYSLEVYMLWKLIKLGYRHTEVPCTKIYPPRRLGYTKMTPIIGWWDIIRPVFLLGLGLRR